MNDGQVLEGFKLGGFRRAEGAAGVHALSFTYELVIALVVGQKNLGI